MLLTSLPCVASWETIHVLCAQTFWEKVGRAGAGGEEKGVGVFALSSLHAFVMQLQTVPFHSSRPRWIPGHQCLPLSLCLRRVTTSDCGWALDASTVPVRFLSSAHTFLAFCVAPQCAFYDSWAAHWHSFPGHLHLEKWQIGTQSEHI